MKIKLKECDFFVKENKLNLDYECSICFSFDLPAFYLMSKNININILKENIKELIVKSFKNSDIEIDTIDICNKNNKNVDSIENIENIENMENVLKKDEPAEIMKPKEPEKEAETNAAITKEAGEKEPMKEKKKAIKFLENPLPLPKPHVSKTMDYSLGMETDQDFDIEIGEDDDFEV